jgi:hypothetical protein
MIALEKKAFQETTAVPEITPAEVLAQVTSAFDQFKADIHLGDYINPEDLDVFRVKDLNWPLHVIGLKTDIQSGLVHVQPYSADDQRIVVASKDIPQWDASVVATFGHRNTNCHGYRSSVSEFWFTAPKYTDIEGRGGYGQGYVAGICQGKIIELPYWEGNAQAFIVFAGINGSENRVGDIYHGAVILSKVWQPSYENTTIFRGNIPNQG